MFSCDKGSEICVKKIQDKMYFAWTWDIVDTGLMGHSGYRTPGDDSPALSDPSLSGYKSSQAAFIRTVTNAQIVQYTEFPLFY